MAAARVPDAYVRQRAPMPGGLTVADVLTVLSLRFWDGQGYTLVRKIRQTAIAAFMALVGLSCPAIARLRMDDWRPGGKNIVIVRGFLTERRLAVTPELALLVERWIEQRPKNVNSNCLFVTESGKPMAQSSIRVTSEMAALRLGLRRPLHRLLAGFCRACVSADVDAGAVRALLAGTRVGAKEVPPVSDGRMRELSERTNPLRGQGRVLWRPELLPHLRRRLGTTFPERLTAFRPRGRGRLPMSRMTPSDHPVIAALAAVDWPQEQRPRRVLRRRLFAQHFAAVHELLARRRLTHAQAAELFSCSANWLYTNVRAITEPERQAARAARENKSARRRAAKRLRRVRAEREQRRALTADERVVVIKLDSFPWPARRRERDRRRRELLAEHFPAIHRMMEEGRMTGRMAAMLFRTDPEPLSLLRTEFRKNGFEKLRRQIENDRGEQHWLEVLKRETARRPPGDTVSALHRRLVRDRRFPYGRTAVAKFVVNRGAGV